MSENLQDLSSAQITFRIIFACAITIIVASGAFLALRWMFSL